MKSDQKEYKCGVCNEFDFENIIINSSFKCPECETEFKRDKIGIMINIDPSDDWKKRNMEEWESIKEFNYPPKYIETYTLK
ncbi:MAG: hypothetical protein Q7J10_00440 [Methanosarcinaceae archaeon]|nr:hypothetical protein [Methanosarcinaceae archaeon]